MLSKYVTTYVAATTMTSCRNRASAEQPSYVTHFRRGGFIGHEVIILTDFLVYLPGTGLSRIAVINEFAGVGPVMNRLVSSESLVPTRIPVTPARVT